MDNTYTDKQVLGIIHKFAQALEQKNLRLDDAEKIFHRLKKIEGVRSTTIQYYIKTMNSNRKYLAEKKITHTDDITADFIKEFAEHLLDTKKLSNRYINMRIGIITLMIRTLSNAEYIHPVDLKWKELKEEEKEVKILSDDQVSILMDYMETRELLIQIAIRLLFESGVRKNELLNIEFKNINLKEKKIFLAYTKNHETRYIFLFDKTRELLEQHINSTPKGIKYVFYNPKTKERMSANFIDSFFQRTKKILNFEKLGSHLLRHTFCTSIAGAKDVHIQILQKLMGHKDIRMTLRYTHLANQESLSEAASIYNPIANHKCE